MAVSSSVAALRRLDWRSPSSVAILASVLGCFIQGCREPPRAPVPVESDKQSRQAEPKLSNTTPEAAFEAVRIALAERDWNAHFRLQDEEHAMYTLNIALKSAVLQSKKDEKFAKLLAEHDIHDESDIYQEHARPRELYVAICNHLDTHYPNAPREGVIKGRAEAKLRSVEVDGNRAACHYILSYLGHDLETKYTFEKIGDGWYLTAPSINEFD